MPLCLLSPQGNTEALCCLFWELQVQGFSVKPFLGI